tara:strand:- start:9602 stop:10507 length:906 start_codon:yes stop_codon:yes gene_type:complete
VVEAKNFFFLSVLWALFSHLSFSETIRIASLNVENYLILDRSINGKWRPNYPKPEKEKRALRSIIRQVNPDILLLQEMGDLPFLNELWMDINVTQGPQYKYADWMEGSYEEEERHLALFSKIPFTSTEHHRNLTFNYFNEETKPSRGLMETHFSINNTNWSLFNLHLKSKWTERKDDPEANNRREKEARTIRDFVRSRYPSNSKHKYIIGGDFNDHKNSPALRRFLQVNDQVLSQLVPCIDSNGHFWTHYYAKEDSYSRLDYLLISPSMQSSYLKDSARIYDGHHALWASDHRMVYADFEF